MSAYPTSLAQQLNEVPEDAESGVLTPSHGGMIGGGHEFDMPVSQPAQPAAIPRNSASAHRPRPVSMPPQAYNTNPAASTTGSSSDTKERTHAADDRGHRDREGSRTQASASRSSRSNRILGDYTLSKTLGAGSMGKVKLATHNVTQEQVRFWSFSIGATADTSLKACR